MGNTGVCQCLEEIHLSQISVQNSALTEEQYLQKPNIATGGMRTGRNINLCHHSLYFNKLTFLLVAA